AAGPFVIRDERKRGAPAAAGAAVRRGAGEAARSAGAGSLLLQVLRRHGPHLHSTGAVSAGDRNALKSSHPGRRCSLYSGRPGTGLRAGRPGGGGEGNAGEVGNNGGRAI